MHRIGDLTMNKESKKIISSVCSDLCSGLTLTQEEADAIKDFIQRCVHSGMKRKVGQVAWQEDKK